MPNKSKAKPRTVDRWNWNSHKFADAVVIVRYIRCSFGVFVFYFDWTHKQRPANFVWIKRICCSRSQLYLDYLNRFLAFFRLYVFSFIFLSLEMNFLHFSMICEEYLNVAEEQILVWGQALHLFLLLRCCLLCFHVWIYFKWACCNNVQLCTW